MTRKPLISISEGRPPPRPGRNLFEASEFAQNPQISGAFGVSSHIFKRQTATERDANLSRRDGETAGNRFTPRSPWGFWRHLALLAAIAVALPSLALLWHAPLCTGWQPSDRCAIAGGAKVRAVNTSPAGYSR